DSRSIATFNLRERHLHAGHSTAKENVDVIDRCGFHFDENLAVSGLWIGSIFVLQNFGPAVRVESNCLHRAFSLCGTFLVFNGAFFMNVQTVVVVGAGIMGRGIAHVAAMGGFTTILNDISSELVEKAKSQIQKDLQKGVEIGKVSAADTKGAIERLSVDTDLDRVAARADIVIEAIPERIDLKLQL